MLILSDNDDVNWGLFVKEGERGSLRSLYTTPVDHPSVAPKEATITSFEGDFLIKVGLNGEIYTYPKNRGIFV